MPAKSIVLSFILICWMGNTFARQRNTVILPKGSLFLRLNPLGAIDPIDQNLSIGAEYRFKSKWSAAVDAAWIFHSSNLQNLQSAKGFIVRPALRRYFSRQLNHYVEAEFHYKYLVSPMEDWVGRNVVNGVPAYEEYRKFKYVKEVAGLQVKIGVQECLVQKKWLWVEVYAGFGVRKKWQHAQLPPGSSYTFLRRMFNEDPNQSETLFPAFPGGVRLLFKIK